MAFLKQIKALLFTASFLVWCQISKAEDLSKPTGEEIVIHFPFNSYELKSDDKSRIKAVFKGKKIKYISILGYTDSQGSPYYNHSLSAKRMSTVASYIVELVPTGTEMIGKGYGAMNLLNKDRTKKEHAENRRVEVYIEL
jgi:outer membrane protein OmpA-like peptidoglycan-associated protein